MIPVPQLTIFNYPFCLLFFLWDIGLLWGICLEVPESLEPMNRFCRFSDCKCITANPDYAAMGNIGDKYGQVYLAKSFIIGYLCLNQYGN